MKMRSYNEEFKTYTAMVLDVFNDIVIDRRNNDRSLPLDQRVDKLISVPCVYGNRSRTLKHLESREKNFKVPMICLTTTGFGKDTSRVHSVNDFLKSMGSSIDARDHMATPIDINFELTVVAKFQEDIDQIVSNFIPFFISNEIFLTVPLPWASDAHQQKNMKLPLVWGNSVSTDYPTELAETSPYRITSTATFTLKAWMFAGMWDKFADNTDKLIYYINFDSTQIGGVLDTSDLWGGLYAVDQAESFEDAIEDAKNDNNNLLNFDPLEIDLVNDTLGVDTDPITFTSNNINPVAPTVGDEIVGEVDNV